MTDYTPITAEVRNSFSLHCESFCERCRVSEYANCDFHEAEFDRWLAEVKAKRENHVIALIKKDCQHAKFGDYCFHDHLIGEIETQLRREGENSD